MAIDISSGASQFIGAANMGREQANYAGKVGRQKVEQVKGAIGSIAGTFGDMRKQEEAKKALDSWAAKVGFNVAPDDPIRQDPKLFTMGILNHVKENAETIARKHQSDMQGAGFENQKQIAQMGFGADMGRQMAADESRRAATTDARTYAEKQQAADLAREEAADKRFQEVTAPQNVPGSIGDFNIRAGIPIAPPTMPTRGGLMAPTEEEIRKRASTGTPLSPDRTYDALKLARPTPKPRDPLDEAAKRAQTERDMAAAFLDRQKGAAAGQPAAAKPESPQSQKVRLEIEYLKARGAPISVADELELKRIDDQLGNWATDDALKPKLEADREAIMQRLRGGAGQGGGAQAHPSGLSPEKVAAATAKGFVWNGKGWVQK